MSSNYILGIDAGKSSIRTVLYDYHSRDIASSQREFTQITPEPGFLEHDPAEIWEMTKDLMLQTLKKAKESPDDVAAVGVTCKRSTAATWDKRTGKPLYNVIVWQDLRTSERCKELSELIGMEVSPLSAYTKIEWLLNHVPSCREGVEKGEALIGTLDSFLVWKFT